MKAPEKMRIAASDAIMSVCCKGIDKVPSNPESMKQWTQNHTLFVETALLLSNGKLHF